MKNLAKYLIFAVLLIFSSGIATAGELNNLCFSSAGTFRCNYEIDNSLNITATPKNVLTVAEYNIDQNGVGGDGSKESGIQLIINTLKQDEILRNADIISVIEVNRNCGKSQFVNGTQLLAQKLNMNYAYAVEFKENDLVSSECTTGNAILSRYPLENIQYFWFKNQCCTLSGRSGGRGLIAASINKKYLNSVQNLGIISTHLEAGTGDFAGIKNSLLVREQQAQEIADFISQNFPPQDAVVIAGDFNSPDVIAGTAAFNLPRKILTQLGFVNPFFYTTFNQTTCPDSPLVAYFAKMGIDFNIDYILTKVPNSVTNSTKIYNSPNSDFYGISDHVPIIVKIILNPPPIKGLK